MPEVFVVRQGTSIGLIVEDLLPLAQASLEGEWEGQAVTHGEGHGMRSASAAGLQ